MRVREVTLIDNLAADIKYCSCFLLAEEWPRMYCLVGYEIEGENKV